MTTDALAARKQDIDPNDPSQLFWALCAHSADGELSDAMKYTEALTAMGLQGSLQNIAFDLAGGLSQLKRASDSIYFINAGEVDEEVVAVLERGRAIVSELLSTPPVSIIVDISGPGSPVYSMAGIPGAGVIVGDKKALSNLGIMAHEMTHCTATSGLRFIDEGLATYVQCRTLEREITAPEALSNRANLAALIEANWAGDEYLEQIEGNKIEAPDSHIGQAEALSGIQAEVTYAHLLAAFVIQSLAEKTDISEVVESFYSFGSVLRDGRTAEHFLTKFGLDLWALDAELNNTVVDAEFSRDEIKEYAIRTLVVGDISEMDRYLPYARAYALESNDGVAALAKLICSRIIYTPTDQPKELLFSEYFSLVERLKAQGGSAYDVAFIEIYFPLIKYHSLAVSQLEGRTWASRAIEASAKALELFPDEPEFIIAAAKSLTHSSYEFYPKEQMRSKLQDCCKLELFKEGAESILARDYFK